MTTRPSSPPIPELVTCVGCGGDGEGPAGTTCFCGGDGHLEQAHLEELLREVEQRVEDGYPAPWWYPVPAPARIVYRPGIDVF